MKNARKRDKLQPDRGEKKKTHAGGLGFETRIYHEFTHVRVLKGLKMRFDWSYVSFPNPEWFIVVFSGTSHTCFVGCDGETS